MSLREAEVDIKIRGIVSIVPNQKIENTFFKNHLNPKTIKDVTRITGVKTRYWAKENQTTNNLCLEASKKLLNRLSVDPSSIEALIFITQTPDNIIPGNSFFIHENLELNNECFCLDVNSGCSGYVNGLALAKDLIIGRRYNRVLLLVGDTISKTIDLKDSSTSLIFGDAGTATLIDAEKINKNKSYFLFGADGKGVESLIIKDSLFKEQTNARNKLYMNGSNVFNFTIQRIPKFIEELANKKSQEINSFDYIFLHQANKFLINHIRKKIGVSSECVPINIDFFGNTSCASIPLIICSSIKKVVEKKEINCAMIGFGVGFSWAGVAMNLGPIDYLEIDFI